MPSTAPPWISVLSLCLLLLGGGAVVGCCPVASSVLVDREEQLMRDCLRSFPDDDDRAELCVRGVELMMDQLHRGLGEDQ